MLGVYVSGTWNESYEHDRLTTAHHCIVPRLTLTARTTTAWCYVVDRSHLHWVRYGPAGRANSSARKLHGRFVSIGTVRLPPAPSAPPTPRAETFRRTVQLQRHNAVWILFGNCYWNSRIHVFSLWIYIYMRIQLHTDYR
jgi:hypothetical protein